MSIETANAARFKKGMMALTPLEGELLEALELIRDNQVLVCSCGEAFEDNTFIDEIETAIINAHGETS